MSKAHHRSYIIRVLVAAFPAVVVITMLASATYAGGGGSVSYSCPSGWTNNPNMSLTVADPPPPPPPASDGGGGGCCFIPGTVVTMADGKNKLIEDLEIGDQILGMDGGVNTIQEVIVLPANGKKIYGINELKPFVTIDHPLLSVSGWVSKDPTATAKSYKNLEVRQVKAGSELITGAGRISVQNLSKEQNLESGYVYTLETDGNHSYLADGFVAHNAQNSQCNVLDPTAGGGSTGCCVTAGTNIRLANGQMLEIEKLQYGDIVIGKDGSQNTILGIEKEKQAAARLAYRINGERILMTHDHPIQTTTGWKSADPEYNSARHAWLPIAGRLQVGNEIITNSGTVMIKNLEPVWLPVGETVYNLILDGNHTYYADGMLVHNIIQNGFISHELYRQGLISKQSYDWDQEYNDSYLLDADIRRGYAYWAKPAADRMRRSKAWTAWYAFFARPWMLHQQYMLGARSRDNIFGRIGGRIVVAFFRATGKLLAHTPESTKIVIRVPSSTPQHALA